MKRQAQVFILLLVLVAVWVYFTYYHEKYPKHDWSDSYDVESMEPYGLAFMVKLLKSYDGKSNVGISLKSLAVASLDDYENYLLVGSSFFFTKRDRDSLLSYIRRGHTAMIVSEVFPKSFFDILTFPEDSAKEESSYYTYHHNYYDSLCRINYYSPDLHSDSDYIYDCRYIDEPFNKMWTFFNNSNLSAIHYPVELIGYVNKEPVDPNFVRIKLGSGQLILNSIPIAFTNFHLQTKRGAEYAERAFSWLAPGSILLDEISKVPAFGRDSRSAQTPLRFILSREALRWAWYTLLAAALLFLIFRSKRRQRIIPVIAQKENSSLEYIRLVSRLFHKQKNHRFLCSQKMKLFLAFVRNRYRISTTEINEGVIQAIAVKSGIAKSEVAEIFLQGNMLSRFDDSFLDENDVIKFHQLTESFYKKCK